VRLSDDSSLQEILWKFSRVEDEQNRLALSNNPHFYTELPSSPDAYGDSLKIDPTEDFQHATTFYVLTDKPELVHIKTDQVSRSFGNFWCPQNSIIFKGTNVLFLFSPFLMSCQTSVGRSGGRASSGNLSEAHTVGSVSSFRCLRFQEPPRIVVDCSRLSPRDAHGWVGVRLPVAVSLCIVLLISVYASAPGK
jgi:hypothetical protein